MKSYQEKETIWEGNKEHAQKVAEHYNDPEGRYELAHGETGWPTYKAVKCKDGWRVKMTRNFYDGTIYNGYCITDGNLERYLTPAECEMYMEPHTGAVGIYEDWWRWAEDDSGDGPVEYAKYNAVDKGDVEPVEWDGEKWTEWTT